MASTVIAGIATALSASGIGIIRVSGNGSIDIVDNIFRGKKLLKEANSHEIVYGHIIEDDEVIDEVLVSIMLSPKSYTMEDVVEINCHGGVHILKRVLDLLYRNGVQPAGPGEFTLRAFLNGRIDLSQAESVMDIISSENDAFLKNSVRQLSGNLSGIIKKLRDDIVTEVAYIESSLDDPEHFSLDSYAERLSNVTDDILYKIESLIQSSKNGSIIKSGIPTAIIGQVNVGKSSLLNALSGWDKAIVTDVPGTTRDTIEERINLGEISLRIIDTAGIRESEDIVEQIGIDKSFKTLDSSELILLILDGSQELSSMDKDLLSRINQKKAIICINKIDLEKKLEKEMIYNESMHPVVEISAKNLEGIDELKNCVIDMFFKEGFKDNNDVYVTNERHTFLLRKAYDSLLLVKEGIKNAVTEDFLTIDLMDAYEALGKIIGQEIEDDVVETIFSKFCIGK